MELDAQPVRSDEPLLGGPKELHAHRIAVFTVADDDPTLVLLGGDRKRIAHLEKQDLRCACPWPSTIRLDGPPAARLVLGQLFQDLQIALDAPIEDLLELLVRDLSGLRRVVRGSVLGIHRHRSFVSSIFRCSGSSGATSQRSFQRFLHLWPPRS